MIRARENEIRERALQLIEKIENPSLELNVIAGESAIGGGAGPTSTLNTALLAITHKFLGAEEIVTEFYGTLSHR